jgi:membrane-associated phospholipid phosphatase
VTSADGPAAHYFRNTSSFHGFNAVLASRATSLATLAAPVSLYLAGRIRRDSKMSNTALLAGQAIVDAELLTAVLKPVADRARPSTFPAHSRFSDTWAEGGNRFAGRDNSFPSGHTIAAFSAAAVIAQRYRNHRWVPILAYGGAAAIGFSRLTLSAHYPSDVLVGGALGYSIGRFAVLR